MQTLEVGKNIAFLFTVYNSKTFIGTYVIQIPDNKAVELAVNSIPPPIHKEIKTCKLS